VSFKVNDGEIVALIGPSGCGRRRRAHRMGLETASGGKSRSTAGGEGLRPRSRHGVPVRRALALAHALQNVMFGSR